MTSLDSNTRCEEEEKEVLVLVIKSQPWLQRMHPGGGKKKETVLTTWMKRWVCLIIATCLSNICRHCSRLKPQGTHPLQQFSATKHNRTWELAVNIGIFQEGFDGINVLLTCSCATNSLQHTNIPVVFLCMAPLHSFYWHSLLLKIIKLNTKNKPYYWNYM